MLVFVHQRFNDVGGGRTPTTAEKHTIPMGLKMFIVKEFEGKQPPSMGKINPLGIKPKPLGIEPKPLGIEPIYFFSFLF